MDKVLFGYCIGTDVYIDIANKRLINLSSEKSSRSLHSLKIRDTMLRLLLFLLKSSNRSIIPTKEIIANVWDAYGLRSSNQRLWQVMQQLKFKLHLVGLPDDLITKVESNGYFVKEKMIMPLYCDERKQSENRNVESGNGTYPV